MGSQWKRSSLRSPPRSQSEEQLTFSMQGILLSHLSLRCCRCCCCLVQVQKPAPRNLLLLWRKQWTTTLQIRTAARNGPEAMDDFLPGGRHPGQWPAGMHGQRPARELIFGHYCCIPEGSLPPVLCIYVQNIFVAVNFEEESNTTEAGENDDSAMLRFEFYEAIVRASMSRCSTSLQTCDVSDSTQTFIAQVRLNAIIPSYLGP